MQVYYHEGGILSPSMHSRTAADPRANQKLRTRTAIVDACRQLIESGREVTMPEVANLARVSEATAYRHFPDLLSLLTETMAQLWPSPTEALAPIADVRDPVTRVAFACEFLLRHVVRYQGAVRAAISATITRPQLAAARPGLRFGLIDAALAPVADTLESHDPRRLGQLKRDLSVVASAEALFSLTDLAGMDADEAITSLVCTATTLTRAAFDPLNRECRTP